MKLDEFEIIEKDVQDIRFGMINIYASKIDQDYVIMEKKRICKSLEDFTLNALEVEERMKIEHPNILKMLWANTDQTNLIISSFFDYPNEDLCQRRKHLIDPREIINFLDNILSAMTYLQRQKLVHGDIRPEYIYYNSKLQKYILVDKLIDSTPVAQVQMKNIIYKDKTLYLSPLFFEHLINGILKVKHNPFKSEVFSLSMVLLSIFVDEEDIMQCYDTNNSEFNLDNFNSLIEFVKENFFSDPLGEVIGEFIFELLITVDENNRLSPKTALKFLRGGLINQLIEVLEDMTESEIQDDEIKQFLTNYKNDELENNHSISDITQPFNENIKRLSNTEELAKTKQKNEEPNSKQKNSFNLYQSNKIISTENQNEDLNTFIGYNKIEDNIQKVYSNNKTDFETVPLRLLSVTKKESLNNQIDLDQSEKLLKISSLNIQTLISQVQKNISSNDFEDILDDNINENKKKIIQILQKHMILFNIMLMKKIL